MFKDNTEQEQFERQVGDQVVFATYRLDGDVLTIKYVEAPEALRGSGEAGKLMQDVMGHARSKGYKVIPICGYAVSWIRRHPEVQDLLA